MGFEQRILTHETNEERPEEAMLRAGRRIEGIQPKDLNRGETYQIFATVGQTREVFPLTFDREENGELIGTNLAGKETKVRVSEITQISDKPEVTNLKGL